MMSFGPHGHANATGANPVAMASIRTKGNPSNLELRIKMELSRYFSVMLLTGPSQLTAFSIPNSLTLLM